MTAFSAFLGPSGVCVCRDIFTRPCHVTGKLLALDAATNQLLPPVVRDFRLSRSELLAAACSSEAYSASHPHVAPVSCDQQQSQ